jgi:hypothetical protein
MALSLRRAFYMSSAEKGNRPLPGRYCRRSVPEARSQNQAYQKRKGRTPAMFSISFVSAPSQLLPDCLEIEPGGLFHLRILEEVGGMEGGHKG